MTGAALREKAMKYTNEPQNDFGKINRDIDNFLNIQNLRNIVVFELSFKNRKKSQTVGVVQLFNKLLTSFSPYVTPLDLV